jgi:hypothetical protein
MAGGLLQPAIKGGNRVGRDIGKQAHLVSLRSIGDAFGYI